MTSSTYHHFNVVCILCETDLALLLQLDEAGEALTGESEIWVPKSMVADADDYCEGDTDATVSVKEWFLKQRGWL